MKRIFYFLAGIGLFISSCTTDNSGKAEPSAPVTETVKTAQEKSLDRKEEEKEKMKMSSVMRYAMATPEMSPWGFLLRNSSWAEQVHSGQYTLLCPTDSVLRANDISLFSMLKKKENQKILDELMASHLLVGSMDYDKVMKYETVETIDGRKLKVDPLNKTIGGVHFIREGKTTDHGSIIIMKDVIDFPKDKLEKLAKKESMQQKK